MQIYKNRVTVKVPSVIKSCKLFFDMTNDQALLMRVFSGLSCHFLTELKYNNFVFNFFFQDAVLIMDLLSLEHVSSFWMVQKQSQRFGTFCDIPVFFSFS